MAGLSIENEAVARRCRRLITEYWAARGHTVEVDFVETPGPAVSTGRPWAAWMRFEIRSNLVDGLPPKVAAA